MFTSLHTSEGTVRSLYRTNFLADALHRVRMMRAAALNRRQSPVAPAPRATTPTRPLWDAPATWRR